MANVFNKTTNRYYRSVHTPDYPEADYLINPDVSALEGSVPERYWKFDGVDAVVEMTQAEKDAYDAARLAERRAKLQAAAEQEFNSNPVTLAIMKMFFKEINKLRVKNGDPEYTVQQFNTALQNELESSLP